MRIGLVNAESYNPLELLHIWTLIASSMGDRVPAALDCHCFLSQLADDDLIAAFSELWLAHHKLERSLPYPPRAVLTPIDFTADTAGQMWGLSFTHEKGEEKVFATTITLLCIVPQHQPPMRTVVVNQLWIDINDDIKPEKEKIFGRFGPVPDSPFVLAADKLLKLFNVHLLDNDKAWEARRFTNDGWIELAGVASQPFVQPLITLVEGKLNQ